MAQMMDPMFALTQGQRENVLATMHKHEVHMQVLADRIVRLEGLIANVLQQVSTTRGVNFRV